MRSIKEEGFDAMNRREFFRRCLQGFALAGLGRLTVGCSSRSLPVTALAVPDLDKDYHREFARVFAEDQLDLRGQTGSAEAQFCRIPSRPSRSIRISGLSRQISEACFQPGSQRSRGRQKPPATGAIRGTPRIIRHSETAWIPKFAAWTLITETRFV